jgi:hypothetical protein
LKEKCLQLVVLKWFKRFASNKKQKMILLYLDSKEKDFVLLLFDLKST